MDKKQLIHGLKGHILFSSSKETLRIYENSYLIYEGDTVIGVYPLLPEEYAAIPIEDYGDRLIIPGLIDLHLHAPQYTFRGLDMDMELLDWLNANTFPEEFHYQNLDYAKQAYQIFTESLRKSATTRACIFATIHREATLLLMDLLEETGLCTMVGKVNMDRNAPDYLIEETALSTAETKAWLDEVLKRSYKKTLPILTPRFIPSCTDTLMKSLKQLQRDYDLPMQSHLSENFSEIAWVQELCPQSAFYGDAYDQFGLFGKDCKTLMAHCVHSDDREIARMKENGVFIAHCPESNMNLSSGIAPAKKFLEEGLHMGLGSDIAGGTTENLFRAMAHALQASKLRWRLIDDTLPPLTVPEVFYLATKGGGTFFGKVGSFEAGYAADMIVLDDSRLQHPQPMTPKQRLERLLYLADDREIYAKYVAGEKLF